MPEEDAGDLNFVERARGYTLPLHRVLAETDPDVLKAYEGMMRSLYFAERALDGKTKELIYVAVLVALGAAEEHIVAHMEKARREGAAPEDVLQAIELLIPAAGVARASVGFEIWRKVFQA
ncbi:MAG TPA: carboxymuconolactone decarboxylase family protein [Dehalococcoidia bacterium]|nr:carboxymuconolactone decarboxylase family protein [Dehalococcoidia bacterium]